MNISLISAMDRKQLIGRENRLPWRLPADLAFFKRSTMGKPMLMGRKTWDSLGGPLPGREHIVITRNPEFRDEGCVVAHTIEDALAHCAGEKEVMVIGGATLYAAMLDRVQRMYLTLIDAELEGDAWFPEVDWLQWREIERQEHVADDRNPYNYAFVMLEKTLLA